MFTCDENEDMTAWLEFVFENRILLSNLPRLPQVRIRPRRKVYVEMARKPVDARLARYRIRKVASAECNVNAFSCSCWSPDSAFVRYKGRFQTLLSPRTSAKMPK